MRRRPGQRLSGTTTLTNCTVSGNSAGNDGGGLDTSGGTYGGTTTLTNCAVSGNSAGNDGGGLYNKSGTTTLTNCTVSGNFASNGGGVFTGGVYYQYRGHSSAGPR